MRNLEKTQLPLKYIKKEEKMRKRVAFIFAGQGSQADGMGKDFYENSEKARDIIDSASKETGIDFKKLMFENSEDLGKTEFTQPAILLVSQVAQQLLAERIDIQPSYFLGHSLGEFSALTSAGALDIIDAIKLVNRRGELMQEACSDIDAGMMAVIGISNETVNGICKDAQKEGKKVWGANFNSDGQVVIAGIKSDLEYIQPKLKEAKAKRAIILNMSVSSHCELLESATSDLKENLEKSIKESFSAPIISNVTAKEYSSKSEAVELLTQQLINPVKYQEIIEYLADKVDLFIEFGNGAVLKSLNRRIVKSIPTLNVSDMASLEKTIEELSK